MTTVLIVEDDPLIRRMLVETVSRGGMSAVEADSGEAGLAMLSAHPVDLILLDLVLGHGMNGLDFCAQVRAQPEDETVGIIALTGSQDPRVEARLFEVGADDFVRKSDMQPDVLNQRIQAVLRRSRSAQSEVLRVGALEFHLLLRKVIAQGQPVDLRPKEYDVLARLAQSPGETVPREQLLGRAEEDGKQSSINVHILTIRRKLGALDWMIETVRGKGYRLRASR